MTSYLQANMITQQAWDVAMRRRFDFRFTTAKHPFQPPPPPPADDDARYYNFNDAPVVFRPDSPLTDRQHIDPTTMVHLRHACILLYHNVKAQSQTVQRPRIPQADPIYFQREYQRKLAAALPAGQLPKGASTRSSTEHTTLAISRPDARPRPLIRTDVASSSSNLSPNCALGHPKSAGSLLAPYSPTSDTEIRRTISAPSHTDPSVVVDDASFPYTSRNCQVPSLCTTATTVSSVSPPSRPLHLSPTISHPGPGPILANDIPPSAGRQPFEDSGAGTLMPVDADFHQSMSIPPTNQNLGLAPTVTRASAPDTDGTGTDSSAQGSSSGGADSTTTTTTAATTIKTDKDDALPQSTAPTTGTTSNPQLSRVRILVKKFSRLGFGKKKASGLSQTSMRLGMVEAT